MFVLGGSNQAMLLFVYSYPHATCIDYGGEHFTHRRKRQQARKRKEND